MQTAPESPKRRIGAYLFLTPLSVPKRAGLSGARGRTFLAAFPRRRVRGGAVSRRALRGGRALGLRPDVAQREPTPDRGSAFFGCFRDEKTTFSIDPRPMFAGK